jgi:hypothetical protein
MAPCYARVAGVQEVGGYTDAGRELWLRLTIRPFG